MFCPPEYIPALRLWDQYVLDHFAFVYDHATRHYASSGFQAWASRGSPVDICEHLFTSALTSAGVSLASPQGQVVDFYTQYVDHFSNLFQKVYPFEAAAEFAAIELWDEDQYQLYRVEGQFFTPWSAEKSDNEAFQKMYPLLSEGQKLSSHWPYGTTRFHSLPMFYERDSFRVVSNPPSWAADVSAEYFGRRLCEEFGGWAICLSKQVFLDSWQDHVAASLEEYSDVVDKPIRAGRPQMEEARKEWAAMGYDKGKRSWEQIRHVIEKKTGTKPSAKSLRDWRDEHNEKKN